MQCPVVEGWMGWFMVFNVTFCGRRDVFPTKMLRHKSNCSIVGTFSFEVPSSIIPNIIRWSGAYKIQYLPSIFSRGI